MEWSGLNKLSSGPSVAMKVAESYHRTSPKIGSLGYNKAGRSPSSTTSGPIPSLGYLGYISL
jgi:hypothetical protein